MVPNVQARHATSSSCETYKATDVLGAQQEKGTHYRPSGNFVETRASLRYVGSFLAHDSGLSQDMRVQCCILLISRLTSWVEDKT